MRYAGFFSAAAALGLSCAAVACEQSSTPVTPSHSHGSSLAAQAPSANAAAGDPDVGPQLAEVRAATAAFHDVDAALAAGYTLNNEPCAFSPAGAMGFHAPNPTLIQNPALDPTQPEVLLLEPKANGGLRLVAVEYLKILLLRNRTTGVVAPWVSPVQWDLALYDVVTPTPQLFGRTFDGPMPGHNATMPWHWDLHAWIWQPNPDGVFAQWNPSVHCN